MKKISLNQKSVGEYPYTIKLAHNNCKISYTLQNQQLENFTLKQKNENIQKVSRPTVCLLHKPVKECDYHT